IVSALGKAWTALHLYEKMPPALLFILAFSGAVSVGHLLYLVVERPVTRWLSQTWKNPATQSSVLAQ
ncbi:MAG: hypothetical protein ACU836_12940, partial [Gammaproteobacteria bacterium]